MPTGLLRVQVCAGLANRIRALVSGICLAEDLDRNLVLHWPSQEPSCCARFEVLFDEHSLPPFVTVTSEYMEKPTMVLQPDECQSYLDKMLGKGPLEIKSYGQFYRPNNEQFLRHLRYLKPADHIRKEIEQRLASTNMLDTVGVHIRRGDNKKSREQSPMSAFCARLSFEKATTLLVATDDENVRETLRIYFPGRCLFPSCVLNRNTEEGMIEAAIDFFALARCSKIIGSVGSSFSDYAAEYGGCPLVLAAKD